MLDQQGDNKTEDTHAHTQRRQRGGASAGSTRLPTDRGSPSLRKNNEGGRAEEEAATLT